MTLPVASSPQSQDLALDSSSSEAPAPAVEVIAKTVFNTIMALAQFT